MKKFHLFIFLSTTSMAYSQKPLFDIFAPGTVLMKYKNGSSASGVIVSDSSYLYLVTARHCLINNFPKTGISYVGDSLNLVYYIGDQFSVKGDSLKLSLLDAYNNGALLIDTSHDIGIVAIAKILSFTGPRGLVFKYQNYVRKTTSNPPYGINIDLLLPFDSVDVSDDSFIFGFPSSLQLSNQMDFDFDRPLLRKGVIAGKSKKFGTIIVDCPVYQGNSGGPVYTFTLQPKKTNFGLIGIVSRSILHEEKLENSYYKVTVSINYSNSGYTVITPIDYAVSLMKSYVAKHP